MFHSKHHASSCIIILSLYIIIHHNLPSYYFGHVPFKTSFPNDFLQCFFNFYMNFQWQARMKNRPRMPGRRSCYAPPARRGLRDAGRPRHRRTTPRCGGVEDVAPWVFTMAGWCFGTFFPQFSPYIGNNHPNWLIFFRGVETTNQMGNGWTWWNVADSPAQLEILISDKLRIWEKLVKYWN